LVLVKGSDTKLLLTCLMSPRTITAMSGPMANIPPTLLSPVAFQGATLHALKLKQNQMKHKGETFYNLDVCGPILPNMIIGLTDFLNETQDGNYRSSLVTHEPSSPFTLFNSVNNQQSQNMFSVFATESLKDSGLNGQFLKDLCTRDQQSSEIFTEITAKDSLFSIK